MITAQTITEVLGDRPRVANALADVHDAAQSVCSSALLHLCERRIATLLGVELGERNDDPVLDADIERAALAFVEQWVIDVASISDAMVADLVAHLGEDGLMNFVQGLLVVEQRLRLGLAWQRLGLAS